MSRTLQEHSPEEQLQLKYDELCALRRQAYRAHVAAMVPNLTIAAWAKAMTAKYGTAKARAHFNAVSWPVALMVGRYGEEPVPHWPGEFSDADVARAKEWLVSGKFATNIEPLTEDVLAGYLQRDVPLYGINDQEG